MRKFGFLILPVFLFFLQSCATSSPTYFNDESLRLAAIDLANDYLKVQLEEREGTYQTKERFGPGAITIDLFLQYEIETTGYDSSGRPAVFVWVKAGNSTVGMFRNHYKISLYRPVQDPGDKYKGFRIVDVKKIS